jgi:uncharacterized protein (DUF952 family)
MIYHITTPDLWDIALSRGSYAASSLETEGFIHCSDARQVERSLNRFFRGEREVVVLTIDPDRLVNELKYEPADSDSFPHLYGELNLEAVTATEELFPAPDGSFNFGTAAADRNGGVR